MCYQMNNWLKWYLSLVCVLVIYKCVWPNTDLLSYFSGTIGFIYFLTETTEELTQTINKSIMTNSVQISNHNSSNEKLVDIRPHSRIICSSLPFRCISRNERGETHPAETRARTIHTADDNGKRKQSSRRFDGRHFYQPSALFLSFANRETWMFHQDMSRTKFCTLMCWSFPSNSVST